MLLYRPRSPSSCSYWRGEIKVCKGKVCPNFDKCKCNKQNMNYDDYVCTTSPHHIRNRVNTESTTFTDEDENLFLINLGEL